MSVRTGGLRFRGDRSFLSTAYSCNQKIARIGKSNGMKNSLYFLRKFRDGRIEKNSKWFY
jgi:hypothetical protein